MRLVLCMVLGLLLTSGASAQTRSFILDQDGCSGGCGAAAYAMITLTQLTPMSIQVFETLDSGIEFVNTGAGDAIDFQISSPAVTISSVSTGFAVDPTLPVKASTFGYFNYGINCVVCGNGGSNPDPGPLSFVVSSTQPLLLTSFIPSSFNNNNYSQTQYYFASDIINTHLLSRPTGNVGALAAPEPISLSLFTTGLVGLGAVSRKRVKSGRRRCWLH